MDVDIAELDGLPQPNGTLPSPQVSIADLAEEDEQSRRLAADYGLDFVDMRHFEQPPDGAPLSTFARREPLPLLHWSGLVARTDDVNRAFHWSTYQASTT